MKPLRILIDDGPRWTIILTLSADILILRDREAFNSFAAFAGKRSRRHRKIDPSDYNLEIRS